MADIEREEMIEQAHKIYDNSRNLISELRWQKTYFCRDTNIISNQEKLFNIWIFDECLKLLEERKVGHWEIKKASIHPYGNDVACSECGFTMGSSFGYKFCPMCGCKMESEVNNE